MSTGHLTELDACLPIIVNNVSSDIGLTLLSGGINSTSSTRGNSILPNMRNTSCVLVVTSDLNAVLMGFLDEILYQIRLVVLYFNSRVIQTELVLNDLVYEIG